jgi:AraC-like DNA-binding protein
MTDLRSVRRAEDYLRAHPMEPLTLGDLARAVGLSSRSLQPAFRNARDTTPMAALQQARLERARDVLIQEGSGTSVVDVALRFGFSDPGRFASSRWTSRATAAESRLQAGSLVHRFHEADPRRGIPSVTGRLVGSRGVNVVAGHHGSTSSRGGIVDRLG